MRRLITVALALALMGFTAAAAVQVTATLTLKSGERVAGALDDLSAAGLSVLVGGGFRHFPVSEVALIDFGGNSPLNMSELDRAWNPGTHMVVLKNGAVINGELFDIGGRSPLRVTVKVNGQDRDISSSEISQVYLERPSAVPGNRPATNTPTPAPTSTGGRLIQVPANRDWTSTGLTVRRGEVVIFDATGEIQLSRGGNMFARPAGSTDNAMDRKAALPNVPVGALIGRIGAARGGVFARVGAAGAFLIGDRASVTMPAAGELFLGVNDSVFDDNSGSFAVRINPETTSRR